MENLHEQILFCNKCGRNYEGRAINGFGQIASPYFFFIGLNPLADEEKNKGLSLFLAYLKKWKIVNFYFDNVVKCPMPFNGSPRKRNINNCSYFIQEQLNIFRSSKKILFGEKVARACKIIYNPWEDQHRGEFVTIPHFSSIFFPRGMREKDYYYQLKILLQTKPKQLNFF